MKFQSINDDLFSKSVIDNQAALTGGNGYTITTTQTCCEDSNSDGTLKDCDDSSSEWDPGNEQ